LDLERDAVAGWEPTDEMRALMAERDAARERKDYAASDEIRDRLSAMGLEVMDTPGGTQLRPRD
jgi:cysteinyl-tRNA synthetase